MPSVWGRVTLDMLPSVAGAMRDRLASQEREHDLRRVEERATLLGRTPHRHRVQRGAQLILPPLSGWPSLSLTLSESKVCAFVSGRGINQQHDDDDDDDDDDDNAHCALLKLSADLASAVCERRQLLELHVREGPGPCVVDHCQPPGPGPGSSQSP
eukprot:3011558-Rhodomonas_salina.2